MTPTVGIGHLCHAVPAAQRTKDPQGWSSTHARAVRALGTGPIALLAVAMLAGCSEEPTPPPSGEFGGTVTYQSPVGPATTEVNGVADEAKVSGTAVTTFGESTHSVQLECSVRDGETWAVVGKTAQTTVAGGKAGDWSAVIVREGTPQQILIWLSEDASDCAAWLSAIGLATIDSENFVSVESGTLVPPS